MEHKDDMCYSRYQVKIVMHPNQITSSDYSDLFITVNVQSITPSVHNVLQLSFIDLTWCPFKLGLKLPLALTLLILLRARQF